MFKHHLTESKCRCSKSELILECPFPLEPELLPALTSRGYKLNQTYINRGILYVANDDLILIGSFYANKLKVKCKKPNCYEKLEEIKLDLEAANEEKNKKCSQK